jgi:plastocyanin
VVVRAVTVAVAVTPASMEHETRARRRRVTIEGLRFMPADVVVAPDHTGRWINRDLVSHNRQAVGGTNGGGDDSGSADPPPRHPWQGRSRRSHGRLVTRAAAVHPERDAEGVRGHSAAVHDAVQGVRQARSVVPDAEAGRRRGHRLHPLEGRDGGLGGTAFVGPSTATRLSPLLPPGPGRIAVQPTLVQPT